MIVSPSDSWRLYVPLWECPLLKDGNTTPAYGPLSISLWLVETLRCESVPTRSPKFAGTIDRTILTKNK